MNEDEERTVEWPAPQEDPDEEPREPWANLLERAERWEGWDDFIQGLEKEGGDAPDS